MNYKCLAVGVIAGGAVLAWPTIPPEGLIALIAAGAVVGFMPVGRIWRSLTEKKPAPARVESERSEV